MAPHHGNLPAPQQAPASDGGRRSRGYLPHIVAALALCCLGAVSFLLWLEVTKRFRLPEPGSYVGTMSGVIGGPEDEPTRFYVERTLGSEDLFFVVIRPGWTPQLVTSVMPSGSREGEEWLLPISVTGPDGKLRFIGSRTGPGEYAGGVTNTDTAAEGSWVIRQIAPEQGVTTPQLIEEQRHWLMLRQELGEVENSIRAAEIRVPAQKLEIEKLSDFISERSKLKATADDKFIEIKEESERIQKELQDKQALARQLSERLAISQRLTPMGKLVSLSRESLEREGRWIDSQMQSAVVPVENREELDAALVRAERIVKLKARIQAERDAQTQPSGTAVPDGAGPEIND